MFSHLIDLFINIISHLGYPGVTLLMTLESMVVPVPSEAVMPFAGWLMSMGQMSFWPIVIYSTLGSIIGSLLSYALGLYGGRPFIAKYGKFFLLKQHHLEQTEKFFHRFGTKTIFISRFIPIIRHLISIPAGTGKMNIWLFIFYTTLGAGMWNACLTYAGWRLGQKWYIIRSYGEIIDYLLVAVLLILTAYYIKKNWYRFKKNNTK